MMIATACAREGAVDQDVAAAFRSQANAMYRAFDRPCTFSFFGPRTLASELLTRIDIEKFEMRAHQSALAQDLITAKADAYYEKSGMKIECVEPEGDDVRVAAVIAKNRATEARLEALDAMLPIMRREDGRP